MRARRLLVLPVLLALLAVSAPALAAWVVSSSSAEASAEGTSVRPPTTPSSTVTGSSVTLSWAAPTTGPTPTGYTVHRTAPTAAAVCVAVPGTTCTDSGLSPTTTYSYSITAFVGLWNSSALTTSATTATPLPSAFVVTVPATAVAGTPFTVTIQARQTDGTDDTSYTGSHALTFSGPGTVGSYAPSYPASATFDSSGRATVSVTLYKAESVTLTVSDGDPTRTGVSGTVAVAPRPGVSLRWTSDAAGLVAACTSGFLVVGPNGQRSFYVGVLDTYGNRAVAGAGGHAVAIERNPRGPGSVVGSATPNFLSIPANANPAVTDASTILKLKKKSPVATTFTASSNGLSSVACQLRP